MDSQERLPLSLRDFFEEASLPLRLPLPPSELGDITDLQDPSLFTFEESLPSQSIAQRFSSPADPTFDDCASIREDHDFEDTNPLDEFLCECPPQPRLFTSVDVEGERGLGEEREGEVGLSEGELEAIISFLVEFSNVGRAQVEAALRYRFPSLWDCSIVQTLLEKFQRLKKTKEELVKYCMRKAFKFILDLPKNQQMLERGKTQKFSFAKSKERFLKKVSEEKSMNAKFLQQIFHQGDFSKDYALFLQHFEQIMLEDNNKKIKYLAWMLAHGKEGKEGKQRKKQGKQGKDRKQGKQGKQGKDGNQGRGQVVRRMPWTRGILERVRKISVELLKWAG